jgi:hypothetical protein
MQQAPATLYCPRCARDCALSEFVALMRDVRPGAKARKLPLLTVWKHKPSAASRKGTEGFVAPCRQLVYTLDVKGISALV